MGLSTSAKFLSVIAIGVSTAAIGGYIAQALQQSNVEKTIERSVSDGLAKLGQDWVDVKVIARNVALSGTATSQNSIDQAIEVASNVLGVADISHEFELAEPLEPYKLLLTVDGTSRSMVGGMPNEAMILEMTELFGGGSVELALASGSPANSDWREAADFAIRLLQHFEKGTVSVEDLEVSIDGLARDHESFHTLDVVYNAGFPDNLVRGTGQVVPPIASPYIIEIDAQLVASGNVPSKDILLSMEQQGVNIDNIRVSSGEPDRFAAVLPELVANIQNLKVGRATISGTSMSIEGEPADFVSYDAITNFVDNVQGYSVDNDIKLPIISPFTLALTQANGTVVVEGFIPSAEIKEKFAGSNINVDFSGARIARGAPAELEAAMKVVCQALVGLEAGATASIEDQTLTVQGKAVSPQEFLEIQRRFGDDIPNGYDLAVASIELPTLSPYSWSIEKDYAGRVKVAGFSPSSKFSADVLDALAGLNVEDDTLPATGEPEGFARVAVASSSILRDTVSGRVGFENDVWSLDAVVMDKAHENRLLDNFTKEKIQVETWVSQITRVAPPKAIPYTFSASKADDGALGFVGYVPNEEMQELYAGQGASKLALGSGEPDGFSEAAEIALGVLRRLNSGGVAFDGQNWRIEGVAETQVIADQILSDVTNLDANSGSWSASISIQVPFVKPYVWAADLSSSGVVALSGFVPDETTLKMMEETEHSQSALTLANGAPEEFSKQASVALQALKVLQAGRVSMSGENWTLIGRVGADEDLVQVVEILAEYEGVFKLGIEVVLPLDELYWSANKSSTGDFSANGYLSDQAAWKTLYGRPSLKADQPSERKTFNSDVEIGIVALSMLDSGVAEFDGNNWSIEGSASDPAIVRAIELTLSESSVDWTTDLVDLKALAQAKAMAQAEAEAKAQAEADAKAQAEAEAKAQAEADAKAQAEADAKAQAEADAKAQAEAEAKAQAEAEAKAQAEAEAKAQAEAEAKAQAEADAKAQAEADAKAQAEADAKAQAEADATAQAEADAKAQAEADAKAELDAQKAIENAFSWQAVKGDLGLSISGNAPDATSRYTIQLASGQLETLANVELADGAPDNFLSLALDGLNAIDALDEGTVSYEMGNWSLSGYAPNFDVRDTALARLKKTANVWETDISTPPASVLCGEGIASLLKGNAITFQSGSSKLDASSKSMITSLAEQLRVCPEAYVEVEGHTDGDGPSAENLTLSLMRAEQVVDALIENGADASKIFAIGYGESLPIASNDTRAGKLQNRRIVFAVRETLE